MIENCIITPTYKGHFPFIKKYLETYVHFVEDAQEVPVFFIISRNESNEFQKLISPFTKKANLQVLYFEDILSKYGINDDSDTLLKKYGRYSFQTLKKMYAIKFIDANHFLILDSESYFIKKQNLAEVFEDYFRNPFVVFSDYKNRAPTYFMKRMQESTEYVLNTKINFWTIESNMWFVDKNIFNDLLQTCGEPIVWCELVRKQYPENANLEEYGLMEALLYQNWLYLNAEKYQYRKINIYNEILSCLTKEELNVYMTNINTVFKSGVGILEGIFIGTYQSILDRIVKLLNDLNITIARCDFSDFWNYKRQKYLVNNSKVKILACSQNNIFYFKKMSNVSFYKNLIIYSFKQIVKRILFGISPAYRLAKKNADEIIYLREQLNSILVLLKDYEK